MPVRFAASAAWIVACAIAFPALAADPDPVSVSLLSLDDAFERVADTHPDLRLFGALHEQRLAERDEATQRPPWTAGAQVENAFGTGDTRGLDSAELTLTLAGVLERDADATA